MRNKSAIATGEDLDKHALAIMDDFSQFTHGTRVLLLIRRHKEGGHNKESKRRRAREVVHDLDEMRKALAKLLLMKSTSELDLRIYMSVSPRDIGKAEKEFKRSMLEADFADGENKRYFWQNLEEKWISALMSSNPMKDEGLFILDIDQDDNSDALIWCGKNKVSVLKQYRTKSGWHMVVKPFNRTLFPAELGEVKDDGLLLLAY